MTLDQSVPLSRFVERCVREAYDPTYVHDVIFETYRVLHNSIDDEPVATEERATAKAEILQEYRRALEDLPCFQDCPRVPRELTPYESGVALGNWSRGINNAYQRLAGDTIQEAGVDPLYDPRSVFDNIGSYIAARGTHFPWLERIVTILKKYGSKFLDNNLVELDDESKKQRIETWHSALPDELAQICSQGDLSDVMHLGSKAMADAFVTYFNHHCLSGALGESAISPGVFTSPDEFAHLTVDHFYSFVRISQKVLAKHLLNKARAENVNTADRHFWEFALSELEESKERMNEDTTINKRIRSMLDLLHSEMVDYVKNLSQVDLSVLRTDGIVAAPFVSQLDSVCLLRAEKHHGRDRAIFADEMGTGKTLSAILADALYRKEGAVQRTLVVCPNQMKQEWHDRFTKYLSDQVLAEFYTQEGALSIGVINGSKALKGIENYKVVIVNYEMVHRSLQFTEHEEETIIGLATEALFNGVEELFKENETLESICNRVSEIPLNRTTLQEAAKQFSGKQQILEWMGDDTRKAAFALATENFLRDEQRTTASLFSYAADFLILDEAHAIKNPAAKRTKGISELVDETARVALLTGTLIPNRYEDISIPLQLVDRQYTPEKMTPEETGTTLAPKLRRIRQALIPYLSRNLREEVSPRTYKVTPEQDRVEEVEADEVMRVVYRAIIEDNQLSFAEKTRLTRLTTLHPALAINKLWQMSEREDNWIDADVIIENIMDNLSGDAWKALVEGAYVPPKYKKIAAEAADHPHNVVVFTSHIEGNTRPLEKPVIPAKTLIEYLQEALPAKKILLHDGQTEDHKIPDLSERKRVLREYQSRDNAILIASYATLGEGSDLTHGTKILSVDLPYGIPEQGVGRVDRITQTRDVTVKYLTVTDPRLSIGTKSGLTIDQAVLQLGRDKITVSAILVDGRPPGREEIEAYRKLLEANGETPHTYTPLQGGLELHNQEKEEAEQLRIFINRTASNNRGSRRNVRDFEERLQRTYIEKSVLEPTSYTFKSNLMLAQLVESALAAGKKLVDVGGGPASLALCGGIATSYDIIDPTAWQSILEKVLAEKNVPFPEKVHFQEQFLAEFAAESKGVVYDVVTCNNMLHWTTPRAPQGKIAEREQALRDINAHLRDGGVFVLGMPGEYSTSARANLETLLQHTGFQDYTLNQIESPQDNSFHQLVVVAKKTAAPQNEPLHGSQLIFKYSAGRATRRLGGNRVEKKKEAQKASVFLFGDKDVRAVLK